MVEESQKGGGGSIVHSYDPDALLTRRSPEVGSLGKALRSRKHEISVFPLLELKSVLKR